MEQLKFLKTSQTRNTTVHRSVHIKLMQSQGYQVILHSIAIRLMEIQGPMIAKSLNNKVLILTRIHLN